MSADPPVVEPPAPVLRPHTETSLVVALKSNDVETVEAAFSALKLKGHRLVNIAQSVSNNPEALKLVLDNSAVGTPEVNALVHAASNQHNDQLLISIIKHPKADLLTNTAPLNNAFRNRPYDLVKLMTSQ
jgi:hypothetical protein